MVRYLTPNSTQASRMRRRFSVPARCPARRGSPRLRAQRPLPSMIMAMCCGTCSGKVSFFCCSAIGALDLHDLLFFSFPDGIDLVNKFVVQLLNVVLGAFQIVLGD